jgi:hypothetical protein
MSVYTFPTRVDMVDDASAADFNTQARAIEELGARIHPPLVTGNYYDATRLVPATSATAAVVADRLYAEPFWCGPGGFPADRIAIAINASAAGNARLGVYAADPTTWRPGDLIDDFGAVDCSTTGVKAVTISEHFQALGPHRLIWLAVVFDNTPQPAVFSQTTVNPWGTPSPGTTPPAFVRRTFTYGALPDPFGSPLVTEFAPRISLRKA